MSARCRCGERIEWYLTDGRRLAYDLDGWAHECAQHNPNGRPAVVVLERPPAQPDDKPKWTGPEPAVIDSHDYQRHITDLAADLGVREQDLAYTVAYRAALKATTTNHTAA